MADALIYLDFEIISVQCASKQLCSESVHAGVPITVTRSETSLVTTESKLTIALFPTVILSRKQAEGATQE